MSFPPALTPISIAQENTSVTPVTNGATTEDTNQAATDVPAETPTTVPSETPSDHMSTQPTTPSSAVAPAVKTQQTPTQQKVSRVAMPVVPVIPAIPASPVAARKSRHDSVASARSKADPESIAPTEEMVKPESSVEATPAAPVAPPPPKSWADLVRKQSASNGSSIAAAIGVPVLNGLSAPRSESLGEVLGDINVAEVPSKVTFLQPRGLVNTGNMCYMNSVSLCTCILSLS